MSFVRRSSGEIDTETLAAELARARARTEEEIEADAIEDGGALTDEELARMILVPAATKPEAIRAVRDRLGMTQSEFAIRFGFAIEALEEYRGGPPHPVRDGPNSAAAARGRCGRGAAHARPGPRLHGAIRRLHRPPAHRSRRARARPNQTRPIVIAPVRRPRRRIAKPSADREDRHREPAAWPAWRSRLRHGAARLDCFVALRLAVTRFWPARVMTRL